MYAALRAMHEALDRPDLELVTANAIFLAPVPPGAVSIDVDILRDGRRASQVAADLRVDGVDGPALRVHGVFGAAHDTDLAHQEVRFPEVPLPADTPWPPDLERPNPFGRINFHEQTAWRPVSPLDAPGRGQFLSWVRLLEGEPDRLTLAVHGDVLGPARLWDELGRLCAIATQTAHLRRR
jgi:acyl-CoA thioesterase superfamily protein